MPKLTGIVGFGVVVALVGCDPGGWLRAAGLNAFHEVDPNEARRILGDPTTSVAEVGSSILPGSVRVGIHSELPRELLDERRRVLVVALDPREGRSISARLVRAGVSRVVLVVVDPRELGDVPTRLAERAAGD